MPSTTEVLTDLERCSPMCAKLLLIQAEPKPVSGSGQTARGAKGAKGSRNAAAAGGLDGTSFTPAVAKGKFSVQASADAKASRRSSGFKMADAKALTRALAKGMCVRVVKPRAVRGAAGRAAADIMCLSVPSDRRGQ